MEFRSNSEVIDKVIEIMGELILTETRSEKHYTEIIKHAQRAIKNLSAVKTWLKSKETE